MAITVPSIDNRTYQELLDEALARIPVHNPQWTNFNRSDPGVTIVEVFAFLAESLLYRSNQIPERNRRKFLSLLNVPVKQASCARGIVSFANERGPLQVLTLPAGLEAAAGQVPFRTDMGLDVLPIEARAFYKSRVDQPSEALKNHYNQLYQSYRGEQLTAALDFYELKPFPAADGSGVDLQRDKTVDGALWVALMARSGEAPDDAIRGQLAGKTLTLGVVPLPPESAATLPPGGAANTAGSPTLLFEMPLVKKLPKDPTQRIASYRQVGAVASGDLLSEWGTAQIVLPSAQELTLWDDLDPLEAGVNDFPPSLEDSNLDDRIITWLRIRPSAAGQTKLLWIGINAALISQRGYVYDEPLSAGTGEPDQTVRLSKTPVVPGSVTLTITAPGQAAEQWGQTDDLLSAAPEVPVPDPRLPPGTPVSGAGSSKVFTVDCVSGDVRFGDGMRGARPPLNAALKANYCYGIGAQGNVGKGAINTCTQIPSGVTVINPLPTWGGADADTVADTEKQISRYLQHRDRLVTSDDFEIIVRRTPAIALGRVDVLPAFNPDLPLNEPGDAAGAVTVMVIPQYDPVQPDAPVPDALFRRAVCDYIDSRRLLTTEVFIRGPVYKGIWVSVGIDVRAGMSLADVREAVKRELLGYLSPLPAATAESSGSSPQTCADPQRRSGWPLKQSVVDLQLMVVASRVSGVSAVSKLLIAEDADKNSAQALTPVSEIPMNGLELPRVLGISVTVGEAIDINQLRGAQSAVPVVQGAPKVIQVPLIQEGCI